jgi:hypothetical protein
MKYKAEIIFGLLAIGILVIAFKDKIFKKKNSTLKDKILEEPNYNIPYSIKEKLTEEEYKAINLELERIGKKPKLDDVINTSKGMFKYSVVGVGGVVGISYGWLRYLPEGALK